MFYDDRHNESDYREASEAAQREERAREARDMADYYGGNGNSSPEFEAWLHETTPDAPYGAYVPRAQRERQWPVGAGPDTFRIESDREVREWARGIAQKRKEVA